MHRQASQTQDTSSGDTHFRSSQSLSTKHQIYSTKCIGRRCPYRTLQHLEPDAAGPWGSLPMALRTSRFQLLQGIGTQELEASELSLPGDMVARPLLLPASVFPGTACT